MKYTKKMRLVEMDSDNIDNHSIMRFDSSQSEEKYADPKVLSTLDKAMCEILKNNDINDADKWTLYNQVLQRYLSFAKKKVDNKTNINIKKKTCEIPLDFTRFSPNESGVFPLRDSLDAISVPEVRSFFEKVRENENRENLQSSFSPIMHDQRALLEASDSSEMSIEPISADWKKVLPEEKSSPLRNARRSLQFSWQPLGKTRSRTEAKRRAENPLTVTKPCKVLLTRWDEIQYR